MVAMDVYRCWIEPEGEHFRLTDQDLGLAVLFLSQVDIGSGLASSHNRAAQAHGFHFRVPESTIGSPSTRPCYHHLSVRWAADGLLATTQCCALPEGHVGGLHAAYAVGGLAPMRWRTPPDGKAQLRAVWLTPDGWLERGEAADA